MTERLNNLTTPPLNDVAISVKNLSKSYRMYPSPKEKLKELLHPFGKKYHKEFWALKDISFAIKKGECVGIIGRNGSGKSTLLQLICGVLQPTDGEVKVAGRISALLELGAGFNREFSGRDNVYMNGALMGFSQKEMDEKFEAIADFADIGDFIEQPVKTYSSGMYVRLAFACAVNVEPDILIVDEALAVGDEFFQRKCYAKIRTFTDSGKTVLFVTHSGSTVVELCNKALLFDTGELILEGKPKLAVSFYQKLLYSKSENQAKVRNEILNVNKSHELNQEYDELESEKSKKNQSAQEEKSNWQQDLEKQKSFYVSSMLPQSKLEYKTSEVDITDVHVKTISGEIVNMLVMNETYIYSYHVKFRASAENVIFGMCVKTMKGVELAWSQSPKNSDIQHVKAGQDYLIEWHFRCSLLPGMYYTNASALSCINGEFVFLCRITDAQVFRVQDIPNINYGGMVHFDQSLNVTLLELS